MTRRRSNHEGSIFFDKSKKLWTAEILIDGKKKRKTNKRQEVVREWLLDTRKSIQTGVYIKDDKITLADFLDRYIEDVAIHTLKPKTIESYQYLIESHIKPEIGNLKLIQIRPDHLQTLYSRKLEAGLSKRTVQYIHAVIRRSLNFAVKWGLIVRNPTDAVSAPRPPRIPPETLTVAEINTFLVVVRNHQYFPIYCIAIGCGLREGEILGLRKQDVDLENEVLQVRQTVVSVHGKLSFGEPKSEASRRPVAMPDFVVDALREHFKKAEDLLFATRSGKPISPRNILRHFHASLAKAGLPRVKFHSLRHTFVSLLLAKNVPPKDVQVIAGHSTFGITVDLYGHIMAGAHKEAAKKLEGIFEV
jgi:integrase